MPRPAQPINLGAIEGVLESLRRGQRQFSRDPRRAVERAVSQLLRLTKAKPHSQPLRDPRRPTYRIDDLARRSGITVRNIRAYQEKDLLPAPERVGRVALFDDAHLARLKIINSMLERGYTAAHIAEMLTAWEHGKDLGDVLGLEHAILPSRGADEPRLVTRTRAIELSGGEDDLALLVKAGLVEWKGEKARVLRPQLLRGFAEMRAYGMDTTALLSLHSDVTESVDQITRRLVDEGTHQIANRFTPDREPTSEELAELIEVLARFRELATTSVNATLEESLERTIEKVLTGYLAVGLDNSSAATP